MITYEDAKDIGINACIDKLGRSFVMTNKDSFCSADGDRGDHLYCFVGVSDKPLPTMDDGLLLTSNDQFPYIARCTVDYLDGHVNFLDCVLPS